MPDRLEIPQLTQAQGQRFFEAFLEDCSEPEYAESMGWSETTKLLAAFFGRKEYDVDYWLRDRLQELFWSRYPEPGLPRSRQIEEVMDGTATTEFRDRIVREASNATS